MGDKDNLNHIKPVDKDDIFYLLPTIQCIFCNFLVDIWDVRFAEGIPFTWQCSEKYPHLELVSGCEPDVSSKNKLHCKMY